MREREDEATAETSMEDAEEEEVGSTSEEKHLHFDMPQKKTTGDGSRR